MFYRDYGTGTLEREFERMGEELERVFSGIDFKTERAFPPINLWVNEGEALLISELPGIDRKDIEISVEGKTLNITVERKPEALKENERYHLKERWEGKVSRDFKLPFDVDAEKVKAELSKGILKVRLPRAEADKPRKITIQ